MTHKNMVDRVTYALLVVALLAASLPALAEQMVICGDSRNDTNGILPRIVGLANDTPKLDAFIYLGDMTSTGTEAEFADYKKVIAPLKMPIYSIPGNHERGNGSNYEKLIGPPYYAHQFGRWRFIFVDNSRPTLGDLQWNWIQGELDAATAQQDFIVLAMHKPLWCPVAGNHIMEEPERTRLLSLAEQYRVKAVLGAHYHSYYQAAKDGIVHLTTGGAGAPLYGPISMYHYALADFRNDGTFTLKAIKVKAE